MSPSEANTTTASQARPRAALLCRVCGYELRGLAAEARCPECGEPVATATLGDALAAADQAWLRHIHRGMRCFYWGLGAVLAALLVVVAIGVLSVPLMFLLPALYDALPDWIGTLVSTPLLAVVFASPILFVVGVWLSTTAEPRVVLPSLTRQRILGRWGPFVSGAVWAATPAASMIHPRFGEAWWLGACGLTGLTVWGWAGWYADLGRRASDHGVPRLARQAKHYAWIALAMLAISRIDSLWRAGQVATGANGPTFPLRLVTVMDTAAPLAILLTAAKLAGLVDRAKGLVEGALRRPAT